MNDEKLTVEETIEILCALDGTYNFDRSEVPGGNIALDEAIMLLDKLMPKKVKKVNGMNACPECGEYVKFCYSFCKDCGQALDWSN